mmetsp:Transcript_6352/g.15350  ORF Transcript_6352/g.15350 Transcript_6352/m.15350 type:complete len:168 (-) Transcript_6352:84-587(-)
MGASKGKLALEKALPELARDGKVSPESLGTIFTGYAGGDNNLMTPHQLQKLMRNIVSIQKGVGEKIYQEGLAIFRATPGYKQMGFLERGLLNTSISAMKTTIFLAFSTASDFYTNLTNIRAIHSKISPDGRITKEVFIKSAPGVIAYELGKHNLVVAADLFEKFNKA